MSSPRTSAMRELNDRFTRLKSTGQIGEQFHKIRLAIESLDRLHANADPTLPREAHVARVGRSAQQLNSKLDSFRSALGSAYSLASGKLSSEAIERLGLKESRYAEEIRRRVIVMTVSERTQFVTDLAHDPKAGSVIAALTSAPGILHGIDMDILRAVEQDFIERHAPDITQAQTELDSALDLANAALRTAGVMSLEYQDAGELDRISKAQDSAAQAQKQMNEALS